MPLQIALCVAEDAEKWQGYSEVAFSDAFGREGDATTVFYLPGGEIPSIEDIRKGKRNCSLELFTEIQQKYRNYSLHQQQAPCVTLACNC